MAVELASSVDELKEEHARHTSELAEIKYAHMRQVSEVSELKSQHASQASAVNALIVTQDRHAALFDELKVQHKKSVANTTPDMAIRRKDKPLSALEQLPTECDGDSQPCAMQPASAVQRAAQPTAAAEPNTIFVIPSDDAELQCEPEDNPALPAATACESTTLAAVTTTKPERRQELGRSSAAVSHEAGLGVAELQASSSSVVVALEDARLRWPGLATPATAHEAVHSATTADSGASAAVDSARLQPPKPPLPRAEGVWSGLVCAESPVADAPRHRDRVEAQLAEATVRRVALQACIEDTLLQIPYAATAAKQEVLQKRLREQSESLAALDEMRAELSSLLELLDNETLLP